MNPLTAHDPETKSADLIAKNIEQLKTLFPEAVTEGKIDFDVLKQLLGGAVDEREEKYGLNWHGKRRARQLALTPSTGTLRPCPEESVDWDTTQNLMIEGDNLEVLKLLQKSYAGKVKLIYIDPPYNTGKDFVYPDNFQDNIRNYLEITGQIEGGRKISSNTEASGRFHTDWLNMMYPRLKLARNLLRDDGVIFVSCDDNEVHQLREIMDDVFGEECSVANVVWQKKYSPSNDTINIATVHDYLMVFQKSVDLEKPKDERAVIQKLSRSARQDDAYKNPDADPRGPWKAGDYTCNKTAEERPNLYYAITNPFSGEEVWPSKARVWGSSKELHELHVKDNRMWWGLKGDARKPSFKRFLNEVEGMIPSSWWDWEDVGHTDEAKKELLELFGENSPFQTPKPVRLLARVVALSTAADQNHIVIDFFAGSGTAGQAVMVQNAGDAGNRKYILVQLPEPVDPANKDQKSAANYCDQVGRPRNIAELTKERLRRAAKKTRDEQPLYQGDLGVRVFKLAPSNIREWEPDRANLAATLTEHAEHLRTDRTEADILFELLLKLGLDVTVPMEEKKIAGKTVYSIGAGTLLVCLATEVATTEVEPLALGIAEWHKTQNPSGESTVVFRDSAFADDVAKTNLTAILQQDGLTNVRSL